MNASSSEIPPQHLSRNRVMGAFAHRKPGRIPIDFGGHRSSGIAAIAYAGLRRHLELPERPIRVYDPVQQLAVIDEDVLDLFGVDTVELGRAFGSEDEHWVPWTLPDGTPCQIPAWAAPEREEGRWIMRSLSGREIASMPDGALYFEQTWWPFLEGNDSAPLADAFAECMWTACASPPGPIVSGLTGDALLRQGAQRLRSSTGRAVIGLFGGNLLEIGEFLYRIDRFLMLLAEEPERAHRFLDRLLEMHLEGLERFLGAVGDSIDVIVFGDDLGTQNGPIVSPTMYCEFFKPRHASMWKRAKELSSAKVMLHCCGGVRPLLPHLIKAGLDAINPVQTNCAGMDPAALKRDFGRDIVFWGGGCDTQRVLAEAKPEGVREHVREQVQMLGPDGYVFQQVHNILAGVPPANICAMFAAVREEGVH